MKLTAESPNPRIAGKSIQSPLAISSRNYQTIAHDLVTPFEKGCSSCWSSVTLLNPISSLVQLNVLNSGGHILAF